MDNIFLLFLPIMEDKNKVLNESGKAGLILAGVAIAYFLITTLMGKSSLPGVASTLLSLVLWAGKLALCIWLMVKFLRKFAEENEKNRSRTFRFGMSVALCSALVYSAVYFAYVMLIDPNMFSEAINTALQTYSSIMTSEDLERVANLEPSMPTITFFINLIWCWLFGTIVSAIASSNICGNDNPFDE